MTTSPPIIGLIGKKRSGKDAFARTLVDERGYVRIAFADPLRQMAAGVDPLVGRFPLPGHLQAPEDGWHLTEVLDAIGYEKAKEIPEVRRFYQRLGTDGVRAIDPGFWTRIGLQRIAATHEDRLDSRARPVVVTDVRFPNEADGIRELGGVIVRIVRPGLVSTDEHISEKALDNYRPDYVVKNDDDLDTLALRARIVNSHVHDDAENN